MDRITKGFLNEFSTSIGVTKLAENLQFEHFVNHCVLASEVGDIEIDILDMSTGDSAQGIDGIAIEVNGNIVNTIDDIDNMIMQNKKLDVKFIVTQTKTSDSFENGEIGNFLTFVETYFSDNATKVFKTHEMEKFIELKEYIYNNAKYMKTANPELKMYYATTGKWDNNDVNLNNVINNHIIILENTNLFSKVAFIACDAQKLQNMYRKSQQQLSATFVFTKSIKMFSENGGDYGYSGVIPFSEYKKIICDENDVLKKVFEDNIRDFLGERNYVNDDIQNTIFNEGPFAFCMLNNGITVVANEAIYTNETMVLTDYQIVNGCQTSHILYANKDIENIDSLLIPIKIIVTKNEELKNKITKATNNQTSIKKEQLEALSSYQKTLEEFYKTFDGDEQLYYERRVGQYRNESIPKNRIVSIRSQIKNASAMFNDKPHEAAGHYSNLLKDVGGKLFKDTDKPSLYYTSSLALFRYDSFIKSKLISSEYSKGKYHAIMLLKYMFSDAPKFYSAKKMDTFCQKIQKVLNDPDKCFEYFSKIVTYINSQEGIDITDRKVFERKETTDILIKNVKKLIE